MLVKKYYRYIRFKKYIIVHYRHMHQNGFVEKKYNYM